MASKIRWILTCDGDCPDKIVFNWECPEKCPKAEFEREYLDTEIEEASDG